MLPDVGIVLMFEAETIGNEILPKLTDEYAAQDLGLITMSLIAAAEEYDRAADSRYKENEAFRELLRDGRNLVDDDALGQKIEAALAETHGSLRVSELNRVNSVLAGALIDLHARIETSDTPEATAMNQRIWKTLVHSTRERSITFWP